MIKHIGKTPPKAHSSLGELEAYSNPYQPEIFNSEDILMINSNKLMRLVSVTSVDGAEILHLAPEDYSVTIGAGRLTHGGIYIISIVAEDGSKYSSKLMIR